MPPVKLAENIKVMLNVLLEVAGEREFTAEMAEQFWGGTKAGKIKDPVSYTHLTLPTNREV